MTADEKLVIRLHDDGDPGPFESFTFTADEIPAMLQAWGDYWDAERIIEDS